MRFVIDKATVVRQLKELANAIRDGGVELEGFALGQRMQDGVASKGLRLILEYKYPDAPQIQLPAIPSPVQRKEETPAEVLREKAVRAGHPGPKHPWRQRAVLPKR